MNHPKRRIKNGILSSNTVSFVISFVAVSYQTPGLASQRKTNHIKLSPNFLQKYNEFKIKSAPSAVVRKAKKDTVQGRFRGGRSLAGSAANRTYYAKARTEEAIYFGPDGKVCSDIVGWYDADGDGCDWYENEPNACEDFGDSDIYKNLGHSANSACCFCKSKLCWDVGTSCVEGGTCDKCCSKNSEYWDSLGTTACGFEPCWADNSLCENKLRPDKIEQNDICKDGDDFETCDISKFEKCDDDFMLCYYRLPSNDTFYDEEKIHPVFYIDYNKAKCVPKWNYEMNRWWDCDKCTGHVADTSSWCKRKGHCMTSDNSKCRCKDGVKDKKKAAERRSYCEANGLIFPDGNDQSKQKSNKKPRTEPKARVNLKNGRKCYSSIQCRSNCCAKRSSGNHKCRSKKDYRTCL